MNMTPTELSRIYGFSKQAICRSIKDGRIKASKLEGRWFVEEEEYKKYLDGKYERRSDIFKEETNYTPKKCSEILKCSIQRIYHHIRTGHIKASRYRSAWVIHRKDFEEYMKLLVPYKAKTSSYERKYKYLPYRCKALGE